MQGGGYLGDMIQTTFLNARFRLMVKILGLGLVIDIIPLSKEVAFPRDAN